MPQIMLEMVEVTFFSTGVDAFLLVFTGRCRLVGLSSRRRRLETVICVLQSFLPMISQVFVRT